MKELIHHSNYLPKLPLHNRMGEQLSLESWITTIPTFGSAVLGSKGLFKRVRIAYDKTLFKTSL